MAPSHSPFVRKLPCGTAPHGIAHIRSSLGHLTLHRHSAWAVAAEVSTENATSRPADRIALTLRAEDYVTLRRAGVRPIGDPRASPEPGATAER